MIFQGIRTSIAKKPYIFVIFQGGWGGPDPLFPPLDPHMMCKSFIKSAVSIIHVYNIQLYKCTVGKVKYNIKVFCML